MPEAKTGELGFSELYVNGRRQVRARFPNGDSRVPVPDGYILAKGADPHGFLAEHYGKATGSCNGVSGFHNVYPELGIFGFSGTIGSAFPLALGWGVAAQNNGKEQVVVCFFGDGN